MRYLGEPDEPAPRLHDVRLEAPEDFLQAVLAGVDSLAAAGIVHSDLSAFNVLIHEGRPWFIDFSDAILVDRTGGVPWIRLTQAREALIHGFQALGKYFGRYHLPIDAEPRADRIVGSLDRFGVLQKHDAASRDR
jgi:RIO kinase 1